MVPEPQLPTDPQVLRQLVLELLSTLQEKDRRIGQLSSQLEALKRRLFGKRSEKIDSAQLLLELGAWLTTRLVEESTEGQAAQPEASPEASSAPRKKGHGRSRLPEGLPRQRTEYHPSPEACICPECKGALQRIGEEVSEQLEYIPASLFVQEHARIKYACPHCQGNVVIGTLPLQPIAKGLPGPGLLAHVLTSKYADHLPLHRQEGILQRHGVELSRKTLCDWVAAGAAQLKPLVLMMKNEVLGSRKIHTDDTTVPVRDKDRDSMRTGRLWIYIGDAEHEHIVFDYTPDRKRDGPENFLAGYKGYLQADAYGGYHGVYAPQGEGREPGAIEVACWAHARRKFFDAMSSDGRRAPIALAFIRELYAIEKRARDLGVAQRHALRGQEAPRILAAFKAWLDEEASKVLPKSPMGEAITYALGQWEALTRYLEDGILEIDNNRAERALRRVAIGRKNWMFAGSDEGGHRAAILYSVIASCAVLKIDPYAYLRDVLQRLPSCPPADLKNLTPKAWKAALLALQVN
jgi:transposase